MKTLLLQSWAPFASWRYRAALLALLGGLPLAPAWAQVVGFPRNETFKGTSAANFTIGGAAVLTANTVDTDGTGYLRLTDALNNQAGYVIDNVGFSSSNGFTISFEFFSYGGNGADGFSAFLVDANQPAGFRIGATGGSLGYAQKTISPIADGVSNGYIGIGIDEQGNYSNGAEGRVGASPLLDANGQAPNAVAIRGAGNGSSSTDYPYLVGTGPNALDFPLDVPTARAQKGSADYRRAYIDVVPLLENGTQVYRLTVRIQHGNQVKTAISNFLVATPPANLQLGFAGTTGGLTNVHEIRNLNLVQAPYAGDDAATTAYNQNVPVTILANDVAPGSQIDPQTVDLDPTTDAVDTSITVPGKGTFSVDANGLVTFSPVGTFAGTVSTPYTVKSILQGSYISSPANITVTVQGADIASSVSGPTSAAPGDQITYAMATANQGALTATNVVPTLQLAAGLPTGSIVPTNGGVYDSGTGLVTFPTISSLAPTDPAVANSVTVTVPSGISTFWTVTASSIAASVPDPEPANNLASLDTSIGRPLPVALPRFDAVASRNDALLTWTTASEVNNDRFEVQRSLNGSFFELVGALPGRGTSSSSIDYHFRDADAGRLAPVFYYRLRQVDFSGKASFSAVRKVRFEMPNAQLSLYPNPAQSRATLDLTALSAADYSVQIVDLTGRVLQRRTLAGARQHTLDFQSLPHGSYIVLVRGGAVSVALPLSHN